MLNIVCLCVLAVDKLLKHPLLHAAVGSRLDGVYVAFVMRFEFIDSLEVCKCRCKQIRTADRES